MAVPTISSISPPVGPVGGKVLVEVLGTGFRVPPLPAYTGGPAVAMNPGVRVLFSTAVSPRVVVVSDTRLFVEVPQSPIVPVPPELGEGLVDLTVENIDNDGVLVSGETVTLASAYAYQRVQLATQSTLTYLVQQLVLLFMRDTIPNVSVTTDTDYDSDPSDLLNEVDLATLPALVLLGPDLVENRFYSSNDRKRTALGGGEYETRRVPYVVDLVFGVLGISDKKAEIMNLQHLTTKLFERHKFLVVPSDPADPASSPVEFEMDFTPDGDLVTGGGPNDSNIRTFSGTFVVRGFGIEDLTGYQGEQTIDRTAEVVDDPDLTFYQLGTSYRVGVSPPGGSKC